MQKIAYCCFMVCYAQSVYAADYTDLSLDELMDVKIYAASKYEQKQSDAPSSVSVITSDDIRAYGWRNLGDLLRAQRGMYMGYDRLYGSLGVRGLLISGDYNTRIVISVDGHRLGDVVYSQAFILNDFMLDTDLIERVEIIRGPSSTLHGATPLLGVVNIVSRAAKNGAKNEIALALGTGDLHSGRYTVSRQFGENSSLLLSVSGMSSDGKNLFFDIPGVFTGVTEKTDYEKNERVFAKYNHRDTNVLFAFSSRSKGITTGAMATVFNNRDNQYTDNQAALNVSHLWRLSEQSNLEGRFYLGNYRFFGNQLYDDGAGGISVGRDYSWGRWHGVELKLIKQQAQHNFVTGLEFQNNTRQDQFNYDVGGSVNLDDQRASERYAVYVQDEWRYSSQAALTAGLRYDIDQLKHTHFSPKLAWVYNFDDSKTLKLLTANAFRTPTVYEMYYSYGTDIIPNPNLKSETANNYEAVFEHSVSPSTRYTINPYRFKLKQQISQVGGTQFQNTGVTKVQGVEFELQHHFQFEGKLRTSYSWQRGKSDSNQRLSDSPNSVVTVNYKQPLLGEKLQLGVEAQYVGPRLTASGSQTEPTRLLNTNLSGKFWPQGPEWSFALHNALNYQYSTPDTPDADIGGRDQIKQDGRFWRATLKLPF